MRDFKIGRNDDNDYVIHNPSVSSYHAIIMISDNYKTITIKDLDSTNGTFVNKIQVLKKNFSKKDHIKIGNHEVNSELLTEKINKFIKENRIDFSEEFSKLKLIEDNYKKDKRNLKRNYQIKSLLIKFVFALFIMGILYFTGLIEDSNTILRVGFGLFGIATILTLLIPIDKKMDELQDKLHVKYAHEFVCPKCEKELFQRSYNYWLLKKKCPSCKCTWVK